MHVITRVYHNRRCVSPTLQAVQPLIGSYSGYFSHAKDPVVILVTVSRRGAQGSKQDVCLVNTLQVPTPWGLPQEGKGRIPITVTCKLHGEQIIHFIKQNITI